MEQQSEKFQIHEFEQYINGTHDRNIDNNDILTLFQDPHPNNNQMSAICSMTGIDGKYIILKTKIEEKQD